MAGTLVANTINTDTGLFSTNNAYSGIAKAWVNFNGSTGAINGSFNVSSITVNTTGDYTVNFTTAMTNANYCAVPAGSQATYTSYNFSIGISQATTPTTSAIRLLAINGASTSVNPPLVTLAIFGA